MTETASPRPASGDHGALQGPFPILPTPLDDTQDLDLEAVPELVDRLHARGVRGLVTLGSGGEGVYLTAAERTEVVGAVAKAAAGRLTVVAGVIRYGTREAVEEAGALAGAGADALLVGLPQYYATPVDRVVAHYDAVARAVDVPVLYYHYPGVLGLRLDTDEISRLFAEVELAGIKESGLSTPELRRHIGAIERPVAVFSGQSFNLLDTLDAGGVGAMSPVSLLLPATELEVVRAHREGDRERADAAQTRLFGALPLISPVRVPLAAARSATRAMLRWGLPQPVGEGVPHAGVKEALVARGLLRSAAVRDPQPRLPEAARQRVHRLAIRTVEL